MSKKHPGRRVLVGLDETNHGGFNREKSYEIFVATYSPFPQDVKTIVQGKLKDQDIFGQLYPFTQRDFVYSIIEKFHYEKYGPHGLITQLAPIMIEGIWERYSTFRSLALFIDGSLKEEQKEVISKRVSKIIPRKVKVFEKPKRERNQQIYIINLADGIAGHLFRKKSLEELTTFPLNERLVLFD